MFWTKEIIKTVEMSKNSSNQELFQGAQGKGQETDDRVCEYQDQIRDKLYFMKHCIVLD